MAKGIQQVPPVHQRLKKQSVHNGLANLLMSIFIFVDEPDHLQHPGSDFRISFDHSTQRTSRSGLICQRPGMFQ